ncbi:MAG: 7,8-didemethyl-8-hydroxy-5-deazariboflavin synthase CofG [Nitrosopumilaceae archaeon]|nr:7,8-didemethyl-8-hydroxy-5-deazariboflavin synthase CofG [Nitrosopumilaceae archaeon]
MAKPVLQCEKLNRILDNREISRYDIDDVFKGALHNQYELFETAKYLRHKYKNKTITFSKKVFFNLINLCRDKCSYCTYKAELSDSKLTLMDKTHVAQLARLAKKYRCVEALLVTGEKPEDKYEYARYWLKKNGFKNSAEYLIHISELVLNEGLFPHTNAGNLNIEDMHELRKTNSSVGIMIENISDRLTKKGMPHHKAPSKRFENRLKTLTNAGKLKIPITTGLLIGIGETYNEIIDSIYAIKEAHKNFGNIQEIILQNFLPKSDTEMKYYPAPTEMYFKIIVALCRIIMPEANIQIPPNLSSKSYQNFLDAGINDWGGISPLTPDYVNPECPWPKIHTIKNNTEKMGLILKSRFPVYPEFMKYIDKNVRDKMNPIMDKDLLVKSEYWL